MSSAQGSSFEPNTISKEAEFKELNAAIRHYSNMRFLILPVYFAINGALLVGSQYEKLSHIPKIEFAVAFFASGLCIFFVFIERVLNSYLNTFVARCKEMQRDTFWSYMPVTRERVTYSVRSLYCFVAGCWWLLAIVLWARR